MEQRKSLVHGGISLGDFGLGVEEVPTGASDFQMNNLQLIFWNNSLLIGWYPSGNGVTSRPFSSELAGNKDTTNENT